VIRMLYYRKINVFNVIQGGERIPKLFFFLRISKMTNLDQNAPVHSGDDDSGDDSNVTDYLGLYPKKSHTVWSYFLTGCLLLVSFV